MIRCLAISALAAFLSVCGALLPCKLYGVNLLFIFYILIALIVGGAAFGISYLFLRGTDKSLARYMDKELNLAERTVTALEYEGDEGAMAAAQREDTETKLNLLSVKALPFKGLAATSVCAALAFLSFAAIPVFAATVPPVFAPPVIDDKEPPRRVTEWEWAALDELIKYVEDSRVADDETKALMLGQLTGLKGVLLQGVAQSSLEGFVDGTATAIRNGVKDINSSASVVEGQKAANLQESSYVVTRLYEIFNLAPKQEDDDGKNPDDEKPGSSGGNSGTGELNKSDIPFFDRDKGYVKCGDVRDEYYEKAQKAYAEGLITGEEWALIIANYFTDLNEKN